jgi:hypothetical protein
LPNTIEDLLRRVRIKFDLEGAARLLASQNAIDGRNLAARIKDGLVHIGFYNREFQHTEENESTF